MIVNAEDARRQSLENADRLKTKKTAFILGRIDEASKNNKWQIDVTRDEMDGTTYDYLRNNGFKLIHHINGEKMIVSISWGS